MPYYLSLQYSGIQKVILRHDRLWSIAGTSQLLSQLNEIELPRLAKKFDGKVIISGGGKFTASFQSHDKATEARDSFIKLISTTLPMLEVQYSEAVDAVSLKEALGNETYPPLTSQLAEAKRYFRGYGYTYNPQLQPCDECGEYPAESPWDKDERLCRICYQAYEHSKLKLSRLKDNTDDLTSIKRIYSDLATSFDGNLPDIPLNLEDLFPKNDKNKDKRRIALWASDINGMGDKLPLWTSQADEKIIEVFQKIKAFNIKVITNALKATFTNIKDSKYLPFRIIVAGGDDLCIVMRDMDILRFTIELSKSLHEALKEEIDKDKAYPLSLEYLESLKDTSKGSVQLKPHSFGGAFVVAPIHTPFKRLHHLVESLMKRAKEHTQRQDNSINWRVLSSEEDVVSETVLPFEKPLFIDNQIDNSSLTFKDYYDWAKEFKGLSTSHRQQIISKMIELVAECKDDTEAGKLLERFLKRMPAASGEKDSPHNRLLLEDKLRIGDTLSIARLSTLFEIIELYKERS